MRIARRTLLAAALPALVIGRRALGADAPIRIGLLRFGTVQWELDVMRRHGLDAAHGVTAAPVEYASSQATQVALQAREVDMVALDWLWVSRQRAGGADWRFAPLSSALGAVVVPSGSAIRSVGDLPGKRLGIAGGPLDKSWLVLRAYGKAKLGLDLDAAVEKSFAAPPLVDQALSAGRLDAALNFWPFAARAEAAGARSLIGVGEMLQALGVAPGLPMVGYVFADAWAKGRTDQVNRFLAAAAEARQILARSDEEWTRLEPLTGAHDAAELGRLRDWYRSGVPGSFGPAERAAAETLYRLLRENGGAELTGPSPVIAPGTFWGEAG
jgi:NitT/TauT family transport system substrate-binding protein